ncbi:hypothetical protein [Aquitalea pelogenes]|uniref:hypothetical protein n=1 Tax=Aquitalea pelogenes TaxID=1293573 RepID=UPI0035AED02B
MKWNIFKKNTGLNVELEPPAIELDEFDRPLRDLGGDWVILDFPEDKKVRLCHQPSSRIVVLGKDHLFNFVTNSLRSTSEQEFGFLRLHVQIYLKGDQVGIRPTVRPGERLPLSNQPHHLVQWTPYTPIAIANHVPQTASHIKIQYRLWCDTPGIPLLIRLASENGEGIIAEHSGASGTIDLMLTNHENIYLSLSHQYVNYEILALGWADNY